MTRDEIRGLFKKIGDEPGFNDFEQIAEKRSPMRDMHAFLLIAELVPGKRRMIECAEHDQIWLSATVEDLEGKINEEQVRELDACGVFLESEGFLSMFR